MSTVKREADNFEERVEDIRALLAKHAATVDPDDDADKHIYAIAFDGWRQGSVTGTAEEIFEAAKHIVDEPIA